MAIAAICAFSVLIIVQQYFLIKKYRENIDAWNTLVDMIISDAKTAERLVAEVKTMRDLLLERSNQEQQVTTEGENMIDEEFLR